MRNPGITYREMQLVGFGFLQLLSTANWSKSGPFIYKHQEERLSVFSDLFSTKKFNAPYWIFSSFLYFFLGVGVLAKCQLRVTAQPPPSSFYARVHASGCCPDFGWRIAAACSSLHSPSQPCSDLTTKHLRDAPCGIGKGATAAAQHIWKNTNRYCGRGHSCM